MRGSGPGKLIEYADKNQENSLNARLRSWIPAKVIEQDFSQSDWPGFRPKSLNRISAKVIERAKSLNRISAKVIERDFGQSDWTGFRTKSLNRISVKVIEWDFIQRDFRQSDEWSIRFRPKSLNGAPDFSKSHWTELQISGKVIESGQSEHFQLSLSEYLASQNLDLKPRGGQWLYPF